MGILDKIFGEKVDNSATLRKGVIRVVEKEVLISVDDYNLNVTLPIRNNDQIVTAKAIKVSFTLMGDRGSETKKESYIKKILPNKIGTVEFSIPTPIRDFKNGEKLKGWKALIEAENGEAAVIALGTIIGRSGDTREL